MRILHTADWHVGRTLHRRQRLDEADEVLGEIVTVAEREAVDLVLVCGDLFEHYAPSAEAERIVYRTLLELRKRAQVVVIAGNHDNAKRLSAVREVFGAAGVWLVPEIRRPDQGGVVQLSCGGQRAQIACLPWVAERLLFDAEGMMGLAPAPYQAYADAVAQLLARLCDRLDEDAVRLLAGHLFVSGARLGGGERELTAGQLFAISATRLPTSVQYVALGHVHRAQEVAGAPIPARYAGSPLQLDFGERADRKSVTLVEVQPGGPPQIREVALERGRRLEQLSGTLEELEQLREQYADSWLRVTLRCGGPAPGLADQVRAILPTAVQVQLDYPRQDAPRRASELRRMSARELFAHYYAQRHGASPQQPLAQLFDELYEEQTAASA